MIKVGPNQVITLSLTYPADFRRLIPAKMARATYRWSMQLSLNGFGQTVSDLIGVTRNSRLRKQIVETVSIYETMQKYPDLQKQAKRLIPLIRMQVQELRKREVSTGRLRSRITIVIAFTLALFFVGLVVSVAPHWRNWFSILIIAFSVFYFVILVSAGIIARERQGKYEDDRTRDIDDDSDEPDVTENKLGPDIELLINGSGVRLSVNYNDQFFGNRVFTGHLIRSDRGLGKQSDI